MAAAILLELITLFNGQFNTVSQIDVTWETITRIKKVSLEASYKIKMAFDIV